VALCRSRSGAPRSIPRSTPYSSSRPREGEAAAVPIGSTSPLWDRIFPATSNHDQGGEDDVSWRLGIDFDRRMNSRFCVLGTAASFDHLNGQPDPMCSSPRIVKWPQARSRVIARRRPRATSTTLCRLYAGASRGSTTRSATAHAYTRGLRQLPACDAGARESSVRVRAGKRLFRS